MNLILHLFHRTVHRHNLMVICMGLPGEKCGKFLGWKPGGVGMTSGFCDYHRERYNEIASYEIAAIERLYRKAHPEAP